MKTYVDWDTNVEKDAKIVRIPDSSFECPKLNKNDFMSLCVLRSRGSNLLVAVKVAHASVSIQWDQSEGTPKTRKIEDAEQYVYVTPHIFDDAQTAVEEPPESGRRRRNNFGR